MEAKGKKKTESIPENPEESNALLEFPNVNPFDSFLITGDEPATESRKKGKSLKRKGGKSQNTSKKGRRLINTSNQCDSGTLEEEVSPWPAEWQRASKTQDIQYGDSDNRKRSTCTFERRKSEGDKQGYSRNMSRKAGRDEIAPACSFWNETEPDMSEKEITPEPVDLFEVVESNNTNLGFIQVQDSDTEKHDTYTEKRGAVSETVATPYENESHSSDAGEQDRRPEPSASSNDEGLDRPALMPVQSDIIRGIEPLLPLCQISPEQKSQTLHCSNSADNRRDTSHLARPQSEFASVSHQAGCSQNIHCTADNNVKECSDGEDGLPCKIYVVGRVARSRVGSSSHHTVAPTSYDYKSASRVSSKEPRTSCRGHIAASYQSETALNLSNNRPNVVTHPSQQKEDAQDSVPRHHTATLQPSSSAEGSPIALHQNYHCDLLIKSVPVSFLSSVQARARNEHQGNPSGSTAVNIDPSEGHVKGSLTITINPAPHLRGEKVPTTPRRDTKMYSSTNKKTPRIRPKRFHRHWSRQKPHMDDENFADDEMEDEVSDDNKETKTN